ncbi:MAG: cyclic pyranopterin monophosphate synthase MoaC [Nitrospinae bacterium]|nr:cyclic pyranopterin monophosphate synthase MoaC [Nitrospinota bacterium]
MALTHFDEAGKARMVDVSAKPTTERIATARAIVTMAPATFSRLVDKSLEKGDVLEVARLAGIMGAKRTSELIPLCHPLPLSAVTVEFELRDEAAAVDIEVTVKTTAQTGVEMEAMTGAAVSALTIYDMCKSVDRSITVSDLRLIHKAGGASGTYTAPGEEAPKGQGAIE